MKRIYPLPICDFLSRSRRAKFQIKAPLTVCIAAIAENRKIYGASDRMMTSGDIEFEPDLANLIKPVLPPPHNFQYNTNTKIVPITSSIIAMTAGDSGLQAEILQDVWKMVSERIAEKPQVWRSVKETVDLYVLCYDQAKKKRAHQAIFSPYGLNEKTFIEKSAQMADHLVVEINRQIRRFDSEFAERHGVETIIAGIDDVGGLVAPHIYSVIKSGGGDYVVCCDSVGFAAVGSGARHAESQFMMAGHSRHSPMAETVLLTYVAKKRSEVAPGVGKGTDLFELGTGLGQFAMFSNIEDFDMKRIQAIYEFVERGQGKVFKSAKTKMKRYTEALFKKRKAQAQTALPNVPTLSPIELPPPSEQSQPSAD